MNAYPTLWQKKILWAALTTLGIAVIGAVAVGVVWGLNAVLGFLQPLLIPVAVAGILSFLLKPLVDRFKSWNFRPTMAVFAVFASVFLPITLFGLWAVPEIYSQSADFAGKLPTYVDQGYNAVSDQTQRIVNRLHIQNTEPYVAPVREWFRKQAPTLPLKIWSFVTSWVKGAWGMAGFVLGMFLVPVYLFYFLINSESIAAHWGEYLPLRASAFRNEVVDCLTEINSYLIAFFRGQILVTMVDGALIGLGLSFIGVHFALLIGLMVAILQLIPYLGALLCWIPAVLIAFAQWNDFLHPALVTLVFFLVFQFEGFYLAPKIVGNAVGLHPMTIIVSMVLWSLIIGGLLGALLAVPLTATLKVLLRRYVWEKRSFAAAAAPSAE